MSQVEVELAYGRDGLKIRVPEDTAVLRTRDVPGLPDESAAFAAAAVFARLDEIEA